MTGSANGANTVIAADGIRIPNAAVNVIAPGLTFTDFSCCVPGDQPNGVIVAAAGGRINLGTATTAIGIGNPSPAAINVVLSASSRSDVSPLIGTQPSMITGNNVTVIANGGPRAIGVLAFRGLVPAATEAIPTVTLNGLHLTVENAPLSEGLVAQSGGEIRVSAGPNGERSTLVVTGSDEAIGLETLAGGGVISLNNAIMTVTGGNPNETAAIAGFGTISTFTVANSIINTNGIGIVAAGGAQSTTNVNFANVTMTSGELLRSLQGTLNFDADRSQLTGRAFTADGSVSNVTFRGGTRWEMTASSNITNLTNDNSFINFSRPTGDPTNLASYKTLTVNTFHGVGGEINMNTFLFRDGSPSDRIIITGSASSTVPTSLFFHNTTGPGALTTGNGILVVQAVGDATTAPNTFVQDGVARGGAYSYRLFQGGINGSDPNDWFLRSSFVVPEIPGNNGPFVQPPPEHFFPAEPPLGPLQPGVPFPIIGPELADYGVVQPIAREMGLTTLGTLHSRVGDPDGSCCCTAVTTCCSATSDIKTPSGSRETVTTTTTQSTVTSSGDCNKPVAWGRVIGQSVNNRYQEYADPQAIGQILGFQTGFDLWRGSLIPGHTDTVGVYLAYANAAMDVNGLVTNQAATGYVMSHTGSVGLNAYSGGAYWTHYGPSGWYVDAVVQETGYDGSAATQSANLPLNGSGFVASLEGGYPIPMPWFGPRFVLEPQGQIIWQEVSFQDGNDGLGPVSIGSTSGYTGRLGLRGKWTLISSDGMVWQPYVQANIWRDWGAKADTMFGIDDVPLIEQATRLEFLGGFTAKINSKWSIYAQGGYQFASDESGPNPYRRDSFQGDLGFKYTW